ncbi:MAG: endonuclease domain-containing protein [Gemmatimonadota bacterium]|nr:endonuclease domain-containing protein [Gemmatimonadota bacterium]
MVGRRQLKIRRARTLRRRATGAERKAWALVRDRRLLGLKFRRQHVIRGFIVDFYCAELRLVVEIDGAIHTHPRQAEYDEWRTTVLEADGYHVLRIPNEAVSRVTLLSAVLPLSQQSAAVDRG